MTQTRKRRPMRRIDIGAPGLPGGPALDVAGIPPEYWRAFSILGFTMGRFMVDHMIRSSRLFDNDMEAMILFGMLAHLNIVHLVPPGSNPVSTLDRRGRIPESQSKLRPVRIRDLAQITGRPRETIRRKLEQMRSAGRVQRLPNGWVCDVASVDPDMRALTMDGVRRFLQTADIMRSVLRDARQGANTTAGHAHPPVIETSTSRLPRGPRRA